MTSTQSWYLLYPSSPSSSSSSSKDVGTLYATGIHFVWVTVAGLLGLRICTNAVRFYYFCIDWNLITQKEWADLAALHFFKQNFISRKKQIMDALITSTFTGTRESQGDDDDDRMPSISGSDESVHMEQCDATAKSKRDDGCSSSSRKTTRPQFETSSCPICLSEFQEMEQVCRSKESSSCTHIFHPKCLQAWLLKHTSCPVCRYEMVPPTTPLPPGLEAHIPSLVEQSRLQ